MHHLEVSAAVRPLKWSLGVKWLISKQAAHIISKGFKILEHKIKF